MLFTSQISAFNVVAGRYISTQYTWLQVCRVTICAAKAVKLPLCLIWVMEYPLHLNISLEDVWSAQLPCHLKMKRGGRFFVSPTVLLQIGIQLLTGHLPTHSFSVICRATVLWTRKGSPEPLPEVQEWSSKSWEREKKIKLRKRAYGFICASVDKFACDLYEWKAQSQKNPVAQA